MNRAEVTYIYHSGFAVRTAGKLLVFDYYMDGPTSGGVLPRDIANHEVYVFSSHGHGDHFNPTIFQWENHNPQIHYVLSDDIEIGSRRSNATFVSPGKKYNIGSIEVETLASTDLGVAFVVSCGDLVIYHAGDLNWWHWNGESDKDNQLMGERYREQIDLLKGREIDLAFVPVDPRLEEHYHLALDYFMGAVKAKMIFPMHFGRDYSIFERLKKDLSPDRSMFVAEITPAIREFTYER